MLLPGLHGCSLFSFYSGSATPVWIADFGSILALSAAGIAVIG